MNDAPDGNDARLKTQEALEDEYQYLYDSVPIEVSPDEREQELHRRIHGLDDDDAPWALCLSGGGIRSATFSLGVLQGLASRGLLSRFNYLSTVSGGGYIGSWLSRWIEASDGKVGDVERSLAGGVSGVGASEPKQVSQLRAYSNYLSPVWGLSTDFFALVSIVLRNLLLNWCVLLPLIGAALLVPHLYVGVLEAAFLGWKPGTALIVIATAFFVAGIARTVNELPSKASRGVGSTRYSHFPWLCFALIFGAAVLLSIGLWWLVPEFSSSGWFQSVQWSVVACFASYGALGHLLGCGLGMVWSHHSAPATTTRPFRSGRVLDALYVLASGAAGGGLLYVLVLWLAAGNPSPHMRLFYATATVPALVMSFWLATVFYAALIRSRSSEDEREWWARSGGWWIRASLAWAAVFVLVIYVPQWVLEIPGYSDTSAKALVAGGGLWGILTGLAGYWSKNGAAIVGKARSLAAKTGTRVLDLAAIAFILALLIAFCFVVSSGLAKMRSGALAFDFPYAASSGDIRAVERASLAIESAARAAELVVRACSERVRLKELNECEAVTAAATQLNLAVENLIKVTERTADDPSLKIRADAASRAAKAIVDVAALMAEAKSAKNTAARALIDRALESVSNASMKFESYGALEMESATSYAADFGRTLKEPLILFVVLCVFGFIFSWIVGTNTFSLHSMYGNRLVRAYLGAARAAKQRNPNGFTGFDNADNVSMSALRGRDGKGKPRLFHVLNLALNLVSPSGDRLEWQQRKAAPFTVTPRHSGSSALGYVRSMNYAGPAGQGISLARAMTISGAAASPSMGYHSSPAVAFVMTLLNVRLGWWLPNPALIGSPTNERADPGIRSLWLLLAEAFGLTTAKRSYVYLSDGGHFENLGLYEMVRRRCRKILVVDATADPAFEYGDLQDAMRKIRIDLGISVEFQQGSFDRRRPFVVGRICYGDVDGKVKNGVICYLKPILLGGEPLDVQRYAALSRKSDKEACFPHQTTADQFFDEAQFESYRMLGHFMTTKVFPDSEWPRRSGAAAAEAASVPGETSTNIVTKPGAEEGILSRLANSAQNLGQGAMLASAITVGGVLGVSGAVALKDTALTLKPGTEISLNKDSLDALKNTKPACGGSDAQAEKALVCQLQEISTQLKSTADTQDFTANTMTKLNGVVDELEKRVRRVEAAGVSDAKNLEEILKLKAGVEEALEQIKAWTKNKNLEHLEKINSRLDNILRSVQEAPPRRNIRGVEGGGR
ncbi:MAG: hypothetical protein IPM03_19945 [Sulfuritalea sp.]|nr:hypothetical protein [Sulfuritalea sp.]